MHSHEWAYSHTIFQNLWKKLLIIRAILKKPKNTKPFFLGNGNKKRKGAGYMHIEETKAS
jgi:hypothetical protein